ncbi:Putative growth response protein [Ceraceosorus bombacis]|uniref:Putative growth response protein n=1 Tax=Ceraceosorus bombacis TaxID=401625 RepID=A0A0P1BAX2_9BASI|nr:Putative growth response protein [Ceraceosorus bombacis]
MATTPLPLTSASSASALGTVTSAKATTATDGDDAAMVDAPSATKRKAEAGVEHLDAEFELDTPPRKGPSTKKAKPAGADLDGAAHQQQARPSDARVDVFGTNATAGPSRLPAVGTRKGAGNKGKNQQLVTLKGNQLIIKQKILDAKDQMSTLQGRINLNAYLQSCTGPVERLPDEHLPVIAKLAQESDKTLVDLVRSVVKIILPSSDDVTSAPLDCAKSLPTLTSEAVHKAILSVADRVNYGVESDPLGRDSVPPGMQMWRWEVRDDAMLPSEIREKLLARREERLASIKPEIERIMEAMPEEERHTLLKATRRPLPGKAAQADQSSAAPEPQKEIPNVSSALESSASKTPLLKSGAGRDASTAIEIEEEGDEEQDSGIGSASSNGSPVKKQKTNAGKAAAEPKKVKVLDPEALAKQAEREEKKRERELKRKEMEEKKAAREALLAKKEHMKQKAASFMSGFLARGRSPSPIKHSRQPEMKDQTEYERTFLPCEYKDIAPVNRFHKAASLDLLDNIGIGQPTCGELLVQCVRGSASDSRSSVPARRRRRGIHPRANVRETLRLVNEAGLVGGASEEDARSSLKRLSNRRNVPVKFLQFESDRRPAWFGTWTRSSNLVGARNPFGQDPVALDYTYDSDAEWEDVGAIEGEEVDNDKEDDAGSGSDGDSEMDDWLVDDLEEEEEPEGEDGHSDIVETDKDGNALSASHKIDSALGTPPLSTRPATAINELQVKKKRVKPIGRRFTSKLVPISMGPHWESTLGESSHDAFKSYQMEFLNGAYPGLNPFTYVQATAEPGQSKAQTATVTASSPSKAVAMQTQASLGILQRALNPAAVTEPTNSGLTPNASGVLTPPAPAAKVVKSAFPSESIPALLKAVEGRTQTKILLIESLRGEFAGVARNAIEAAVDQYTEREGKKATSKWVVKANFKHLVV